MLFSWLTEKGILAMNPAREVKTEKFSRTEGKTPAFDTEQVQKVLDKIDTRTEVGLRDRALLGTLPPSTFRRTVSGYREGLLRFKGLQHEGVQIGHVRKECYFVVHRSASGENMKDKLLKKVLLSSQTYVRPDRRDRLRVLEFLHILGHPETGERRLKGLNDGGQSTDLVSDGREDR
jgi:hypothetical protein